MINAIRRQLYRGRPRKPPRELDQGTPELRQKCSIIYQKLNSHKNAHLAAAEVIRCIAAVREGSLLHQLFLQDKISFSEFKTGIAYAAAVHRAYISMGIPIDLKIPRYGWERMIKNSYPGLFLYDRQEENERVEYLWRQLVNQLSQRCQQGLSHYQIMSRVVFNCSTNQPQCTLAMIKSALSHVHNILRDSSKRTSTLEEQPQYSARQEGILVSRSPSLSRQKSSSL